MFRQSGDAARRLWPRARVYSFRWAHGVVRVVGSCRNMGLDACTASVATTVDTTSRLKKIRKFDTHKYSLVRGDGVVRVLLVVVFSESRSRSALRLRLVMCCEHTIPRRRGALCRRRLDKRRPGHWDNGTTTTTNRTLLRTSRRLRPPAPHALHDLQRRDGAAPL